MIEIDVRGLSCPIPIVKTKEAIDNYPGQPILVVTESEVSKENVTRLAESKGYKVQEERDANEYRLLLNFGR